jgi:hypothetical protein
MRQRVKCKNKEETGKKREKVSKKSKKSKIDAKYGRIKAKRARYKLKMTCHERRKNLFRKEGGRNKYNFGPKYQPPVDDEYIMTEGDRSW